MTEEVAPKIDRRRRRPALEDPSRSHQSEIPPLDEADLDQTQLAESSFNLDVDAHAAAQGLAHGRVVTARDGEGSATSESGLSWRRQSSDRTASFATSPQSHTSTFDVHSLLRRIRQLEGRLEQFEAPRNTAHDAVVRPLDSRLEQGQSRGSADDRYYQGPDMHVMPRSIMNKNRYFGQSHWANSVLLCKSTLEIFEQHIRSEHPELMLLIQQMKPLGRAIKSHRTPKLTFDFGTNIPAKEVADRLVTAYCETLESVYRILHVPSFRVDYEHYWAAPAVADPGFVIQLQLVMAIGGAVYDDLFSMRKSAVQWVYEAQTWLIAPRFKSKFNFISLQNMALLCLARQTTSLGGDLVWVSMGSVLRSAIYSGLHRDPEKLPKMTQFRTEMRRRLWGTILELTLQSSLDSGGPPMISLEECDTHPATNCDDEDLGESNGVSLPQPAEGFTDMSIALVFRESLSIRLAIVNFLNNMKSKGTYKETLRLHELLTLTNVFTTQLSTAYKSMSRSLQALTSNNRAPSLFQKRILDMIFSRYFIALHVPFFASALTEPAYAFSRKMAVEMSLKAYYCARPKAAAFVHHVASSGPSIPTPTPDLTTTVNVDEYACLSLTGGGFFRYVPHQANVLIALELQNQLQDDVAFGLPTARPDLLNALHDASDLTIQRVRAGETNVKGFLFTTALSAQIDASLQGMDKAGCEQHILKKCVEAGQQALEILKQHAAYIPATADSTSVGVEQLGPNAMDDTEEEWDAMQGVFFDFTNIDSVLGLDVSPEQELGGFS
ncbi:hypothetical protein SLS62_005347 [Diatrype stigma]|uniref:Xylanolytic transcriptional activator regulatory domain-containing protein n=1 Tax=Diatrype stigma TaxID=117547 RepID=A0AAN9YT05_9PEZI